MPTSVAHALTYSKTPYLHTLNDKQYSQIQLICNTDDIHCTFEQLRGARLSYTEISVKAKLKWTTEFTPIPLISYTTQNITSIQWCTIHFYWYLNRIYIYIHICVCVCWCHHRLTVVSQTQPQTCLFMPMCLLLKISIDLSPKSFKRPLIKYNTCTH